MKKILTFLTTILLTFSVMADDHMTPPSMFPIEGIQCKYNEGMGLTDLQKTVAKWNKYCLLYTSPSPRDRQKSRMPSSA